nr:killer cell lectin-like receptor subfamily G member 2 isoform X2 [Saimiri boliviensis boliviensis]
MERAKAAAPESQAGAKVPMEPVGNLLPRLEQPQVPAETRQPEGPESSPTPAGAGEEAAGAGREPSSEKQLPSPRPGPLRVPPLSLGYGAFGGLGSACPEPRSPGPLSAETPRNSEAPGAEPASGAWAPIELQVEVLVKPVGAAGGSSTPSPRPSTRFLTVPVPESPAFSRSAAPAHQLLQRAPSPGGTWGRGSRLAAARTESGRDAEGPASPAEGSADSPSSRTCCRCKELGLEKEGAALLPCAELHRDKKLPRAVTHLVLVSGLPGYSLCCASEPLCRSPSWRALPSLLLVVFRRPRSSHLVHLVLKHQEHYCRQPPAMWCSKPGPPTSKTALTPLWFGLSMYMKSLRRALAVMAVLLAVSGVVIVVLASRAGPSEQIPSLQALLGGGPARTPGLALDRWGPHAAPATPRGWREQFRYQLRGPGGRHAGGCKLQHSKTLGLCQGDPVIWALPVLSLPGGCSTPTGEAS